MDSSFSQAVYRALRKIPSGKVTTYGAIARAVGRPGAARAVGQVLHRNPTPIVVPCHRVVQADGRVGGYVDGIRKKVMLLRREGLPIKANHIVDFEKYVVPERSPDWLGRSRRATYV